MNNLTDVFKATITRIQSPTTAVGKSSRDGLITGLAWIGVILLENINGIDFGGSDVFIATIIGGLIASLNRKIRPIKREN